MYNTVTDTPDTTHAVTHDIDGLASRLLKQSLFINVLAPAFFFLVAYLVRAGGILPATPLVDSGVLQILFYALLFVAVSEIGVAYVIKKTLFAPDKVRAALADPNAFTKLVTGGTITLAAIGATSIMYGIVLYLLGMEVTQFALFALIAMLHFRLFRPNADFLRSLIAQAR